MRKYLILAVVAVAFIFTSCEKDTEPGGTAVQAMAGEWWVTVGAVDENYNVIPGYENLYGEVELLTYNTAANTDSMWIDDMGGNIWLFKVRIPVDLNKSTFGASDTIINSALYKGSPYDIKILAKDGKMLPSAAKSPSGMPVDSIVFYIGFEDDNPAFSMYKVSGFRRTGFPADDF